jgi:transcriptional regulator with XRE-family HTH domain
MRAIAKAMGFPPEAWFEESVSLDPDGPRDEGPGIAGRAEHLFDAIRNPKTGESYTNADVARMTLGDLSREDIEGIRIGAISDPPVSQVAALAAAFGVPPSYLLDRGKDPAVFNEEALEALADETAGAILRESARLPERETWIVLGIVRQFAGQPDGEDGR